MIDYNAFTVAKETRTTTATQSGRPVREIRTALRDNLLASLYSALAASVTDTLQEEGIVTPSGHHEFDDTDLGMAIKSVFNMIAPEDRKMDSDGAQAMINAIRESLEETEEDAA